MNQPPEIAISLIEDSDKIPNKKAILQDVRKKVFEKWKSQDPKRSQLERYPRRIFKKDPQLKNELIFLTDKVQLIYNNCMTDLYHSWIQEHDDRPYLDSKNRHELKLAKWFSKLLRKGNPPELILEKHRKLPFNHLRQYQEWCNVNRRYPSVHGNNRREKRLAKWSIAVRIKYSKDQLDENQAKEIKEKLGEDWLTNAPFFKSTKSSPTKETVINSA
jgi:hypothetical protein